MNSTPALHARRKNHVPDEEGGGLSSSQRLMMSEMSHCQHPQSSMSLLQLPLPQQQLQPPPSTKRNGSSSSKRSLTAIGISLTSIPSSTALSMKQRSLKVMEVVRLTYVMVSVFVLIAMVLAYLLLHHQHRKVIVHVIRNPWAHGRAAFHHMTHIGNSNHNRQHSFGAGGGGIGKDGFHHHFYSGNPKFVTVVLPSVINPNGRPKRLETIHDTWGPLARALYVVHDINEFSKASHLTIGSTIDQHPYDRYAFPQNLLLPSHIHLDHGISRLFYTIQTIYERVNPDFAYFVNDHTYVIPAHLCHYLEETKVNPETNVYAGHALKNGKPSIFNSGAAGYVLSRATMKLLVEKYNNHDPNCWVDTTTAAAVSDHNNNNSSKNQKRLETNPGLLVADCLRSVGITAIDTRQNNKYHRFHAFPLVRMVSGDVDAWYINKHQFDELPQESRIDFDATYSTVLVGPDCCSNDSISFHYVEAMECMALYSVQQMILDRPKMVTNDEIQRYMEQNWPSDTRDIGGFSRKLPKSTDLDEWRKLITTIRKISTRDTQTDC